MTVSRRLILLFVAFHPSPEEVLKLQGCLDQLPGDIGYGVAVNDCRPGEPATQLALGADLYIENDQNLGYGAAVNRLVHALEELPEFLGIMNTDLSWNSGGFELLLNWLAQHPDVVLAVPQIVDPFGNVQKLCKQDPSLLSLFSRRFLPNWLKPKWLRRLDASYTMDDKDYYSVFDVPYLSGCCMIVRQQAFCQVGGFDERFFLYLEDADITRLLRGVGRCVHAPLMQVVHAWGRGNHRSLFLTLVNFHSAWVYFRKWGWRLY